MAGMFNRPSDATRLIAQLGLSKQKRDPSDFVDEEGLLCCGFCKERKQTYISAPDPTPEEPDRKVNILAVASCRCEREKDAREQKEKREREDRELIDRLRRGSMMDNKLLSATFDKFKPNKYNDRNYKVCYRYATAFDQMVEKNQGLILWGDVGTGKSFAAACIANYLLDHKVSVVMTSFVRVLEIIQDGGEKETALMDRLSRAKLVIFDDLGAERSTSYALEKVYNLIDDRYSNQRPMILTTNLTMDQMKSEIEPRFSRIYDRIFECCYPIQFTGPSWRRVEAKNRYFEMNKLFEDV